MHEAVQKGNGHRGSVDDEVGRAFAFFVVCDDLDLDVMEIWRGHSKTLVAVVRAMSRLRM